MEQSEGVARFEPATALDGAAIDGHRWPLPVIALGTILAPLNSTMIAVAFPEIRRSFGASVTDAAWLITISLAAMNVAHPIGGWLGDAFVVIFVHPPRAGEHGSFSWLFAGLTVVALAGIAATARVATWNPAGDRAA